MTDRCEPLEHLRGVDGWHWVQRDGAPQPEVREWVAGTGGPDYWWWADNAMTHTGWRYVAPVPSPEAVRALVEAAKASQAAMLSALDYLRHIDTCASCEIALEDAALAMKTALVAIQEPGT